MDDLDAIVDSVTSDLDQLEGDVPALDETLLADEDDADSQDDQDGLLADDVTDEDAAAPDLAAEVETLRAQMESVAGRATAAEQAKAEQDRRMADAAAQLEQMRFVAEMQESEQYAQQLEETDPDLARTYRDHRGRLASRLVGAETQIGSMERGVVALDMALNHLAPEVAERIYEMATRLAKEPDADSMKRSIAQAAHDRAEKSRELDTLKTQISALQRQIKASQRDPAADRVASAPGSAPRAPKPGEADSFDDYFDRLTASPEYQQVFGTAG